jgi:hypothetical protein
MIRKIEQDFRTAELNAIDGMLAQLKSSDFIAQWDLESRRDEIQRAILADQNILSTTASAALFFSGAPVRSNRGIDSAFAAEVIAGYQDVVSKVFAVRQAGPSGERGMVRDRDQSKLQVTEVVRGSFGFQFEEVPNQEPMFESDLHGAVDQVTKLMLAFDEPDDESYTTAVGDVDERVLTSIRGFFESIRESNATFRIVSGEIDKSFDARSIARAIQRAVITSVHEEDMEFEGVFSGALPDFRDFAFRTNTDRGSIKGKIDPRIPDNEVAAMNRTWADIPSRIDVHVKQVKRQGIVRRESFLLKSISPIMGNNQST